MSTEEFPGREVLAQLVVNRRNYLGISQAGIGAHGGPSPSILSKIENARNVPISSRTFSGLDRSLKWTAGVSESLARTGLQDIKIRADGSADLEINPSQPSLHVDPRTISPTDESATPPPRLPSPEEFEVERLTRGQFDRLTAELAEHRKVTEAAFEEAVRQAAESAAQIEEQVRELKALRVEISDALSRYADVPTRVAEAAPQRGNFALAAKSGDTDLSPEETTGLTSVLVDVINQQDPDFVPPND